jgi:hypothetical protein
MKTILVVVGVLLIVAGALSFAGVGITTEKSSIEVGPIEARVTEKQTLPPAVAGGAIVVGVLLLWSAASRRSR